MLLLAGARKLGLLCSGDRDLLWLLLVCLTGDLERVSLGLDDLEPWEFREKLEGTLINSSCLRISSSCLAY